MLQQLKSNSPILHICGLICALSFTWLTANSQSYGDANLFDLSIVYVIVAAVSATLWFYYWREQKVPTVTSILLWAAAFRVIGVFAYPVLEDDHFRYLWDGYQWIELGSPYATPPSFYFDDPNIPERFAEILSFINYPNIATIYGPLNQWLFGLAYLIAPGEAWPLQVFCAVFDIGVVFLLTKLTNARNVILYAFSPLVVKEFSMTAHPDIFGVFFMVLALYLFTQKRNAFVAIALALALASKVFAILIVPFFLGLRMRAWLVFSITLCAITLTFYPSNPWFPDGLQAMGASWVFNAPLYFVFDEIFSTLNTHYAFDTQHFNPYKAFKYALIIGFMIFITCYGLRYFRTSLEMFFREWKLKSPSSIPRGDLIYGVFFLVIPAMNPWYFVWLLPFACIFPSLWAWTASFSLIFAYFIGLNLPSSELDLYGQPWWAWTLETSMIGIAIFVGRSQFIKRYFENQA